METIATETLNLVLDDFVQEAQQAFGSDLHAVILFGSAAEGRLRPMSDVNLLLCLEQFDAARVDEFRGALRACHSAIRASVMFLLRDELPEAARLFAVKFNDIKARHRVLHGVDPFTDLVIDKAELRRRTREVLLDLSIRLRERYALLSLREEQLVSVIAEAASPLRAAALALLEMRGDTGALSPREALVKVAADSAKNEFVSAVATLPLAREDQALAVGQAGPVLLQLSALATYLLAGLNAAEPVA
jgi:hypothetical protein